MCKPRKPVKAWRLLIDEDIIRSIFEFTNKKLHIFLLYMANVLWVSLFGLLYLAGVFKSNNEVVESLFSTDGTSPDMSRDVMSLKRFLFFTLSTTF
ncbi:hypothetical protein PR048_025707 [Dryococelus australis]|uniref:PiggyBac transposable element-derived protein domain-containing protein n=1 Tax=Dryococelus australis TaxID=614101 RepID=A0ABQ9GJ75_9NEOP|nr:hypothetical protein PR048_025707 [Dryococelus australis]